MKYKKYALEIAASQVECSHSRLCEVFQGSYPEPSKLRAFTFRGSSNNKNDAAIRFRSILRIIATIYSKTNFPSTTSRAKMRSCTIPMPFNHSGSAEGPLSEQTNNNAFTAATLQENLLKPVSSHILSSLLPHQKFLRNELQPPTPSTPLFHTPSNYQQ